MAGTFPAQAYSPDIAPDILLDGSKFHIEAQVHLLSSRSKILMEVNDFWTSRALTKSYPEIIYGNYFLDQI